MKNSDKVHANSKFNFSYEKVLRVREIDEEKKSMALASALKELERRKTELESLQVEKATAQAEMQGKTFRPYELQMKADFIEQMNERIDAQGEKIREQEALVKTEEAKLVEASKSRKVMEKLKENHAQTFRMKRNSAEQKDSDEMNSQRWKNPRGKL